MANSEQMVTPEGARIGWTPVPDPTKLTTDAVNLATTQMRRELETQREIIEARILAGENDSRLQLEGLRQVRPEIERQIGQLKDLHDERFRSIEALIEARFDSIALQFTERDTRAERESRDNTKAVDAAFAAQKEAAAKEGESNQKAIDKSERATTEIIKTNQEQNKSTTDTLTKSLDEVRLDVSRILAAGVGASQQRSEQRSDVTGQQGERQSRTASAAMYVAAIVGAFVVLGAVINLVLALTHK